MAYLSADQLAERLKQKTNLLRIEHEGNTKVWFSPHVPDELPIGVSAHRLSTEKVALPYNHYFSLAHALTGWMIYWRHTGPRYVGAGAFISVSPLGAKKPVVDIELGEWSDTVTEDSQAQWLFGFESRDYVSYLCKGLTEGLLVSYLGHPLADVRIRLLNALSHKIDSSAMAFQVLGKWLMNALIFEMYKRDWIK